MDRRLVSTHGVIIYVKDMKGHMEMGIRGREGIIKWGREKWSKGVVLTDVPDLDYSSI